MDNKTLYVVIIVVAILLFLMYMNKKDEKGCKECQCAGSECGLKEDQGPGLLPVMESEFNLRECAKQMILLEDHLNNPRKFCTDCCKKHFLTLEGLAEEGASINGEKDCKAECNRLAEHIRMCEKRFLSGEDPSDIAQDLRKLRKPLMYKYFDKFN